MAFLHPECGECTKSELDLFTIPPTQTSIIGGHWIEVQPLSSLMDGPIEFAVSGSGDDYIDFSKSWLQIVFKITNEDGTNLEDNAAVAPVNNFLHSLFSQIDLSLNGTLVSISNNTYPYRAYVENLLSYGEDAKNSQLTSELYYQDSAGHFNDIPNAAGANTNPGQQKRRALCAGSAEVEMIGRLHLDMFHQPKLLLNGVDAKLRLSRSKTAFHLMHAAGNNYKTRIQQATLHIRKVKVNPKSTTRTYQRFRKSYSEISYQAHRCEIIFSTSRQFASKSTKFFPRSTS